MSVFKKKKNTVGYRYFLGMHMVLCHGRLDSLNEIFVDGDRSIWSGLISSSKTITIDQPDVFGGDNSEGGVSGDLDVIWGTEFEAKNEYLEEHAGAVPAFRGVVSVVLKQMYLGNNSYLKPWSFKATRTQTFDFWYPDKAAIGGVFVPGTVSRGGKVLLIVDTSYSMSFGLLRTREFTMRLFNYVKELMANPLNDYEFATYCVSDFGNAISSISYKMLDGTVRTFSGISPTGRQPSLLHQIDWYDPLTWYTFGVGYFQFRFKRPDYEFNPYTDKWVYKSLYEDYSWPLAGNARIEEPVNTMGEEFWDYDNGPAWIDGILYYGNQLVQTTTSWSEISNLYVGHGLDNTYVRTNKGTWTSNVHESYMVSPNILSTFLDLETPENKVVVIFSDVNSESGLRQNSMFMPSNSLGSYTFNTFDLTYVNLEEGDTFYRAIRDSALYSKKEKSTGSGLCTYEKRNLIKCMNVVVTKEKEQQLFPWHTPPYADSHHNWSAPFSSQTMGTMASNYFDSVPVLDSANGANADTLFENFKKMLRWEYDTPDPHGGLSEPGAYDGDMNPAHIIRECLTNPIWGMGYPSSDIDNISFMHAADVFYDENLGISLLLEKETTVEDFIKEILRHVDAVLYIDRRTGSFCLKPVRDDYSVSSLLVLDESNVASMSDYSKPTLGELTNSITVNAWDKKTNTPLSVTVQNAALSMIQGREIGTKIQYPGITNRENATRLAQRDLRTYSTPLVRCTLEVNDIAEDLQVGGVFAFSWKDYEIDKLPMRIVGIDYGTDRKHTIRITCVQDVFATPTSAIVGSTEPTWEDPILKPPSPVSDGIAIEAPYYELCAQLGQTQVDSNLDNAPELGCALIAAVKPRNATTGYAYWEDNYAENHEVGNFSFTALCKLIDALDMGATGMTATISDADAPKVRVNAWALIDNEIIAITTNMGNAQYEVGANEWHFFIKRGCFDTQPAAHLPGATVYLMSDNNILDVEQLVKGETRGYLLSSINSTGQLSPNFDYPTSVTFDERAIRPYPPQGVRINGYYFNERILTEVDVQWYHRNRKLQTGGEIIGFDEFAFSSPEPGTTYTLELIDNMTGSVIYLVEGLTGASFDIPQGDIPFELPDVNLRLSSVRDGIKCMQPYEQRIYLSLPSGGNLLFDLDTDPTPPSGDAIELILD